jgi:hypothetical protein
VQYEPATYQVEMLPKLALPLYAELHLHHLIRRHVRLSPAKLSIARLSYRCSAGVRFQFAPTVALMLSSLASKGDEGKEGGPEGQAQAPAWRRQRRERRAPAVVRVRRR